MDYLITITVLLIPVIIVGYFCYKQGELNGYMRASSDIYEKLEADQ